MEYKTKKRKKDSSKGDMVESVKYSCFSSNPKLIPVDVLILVLARLPAATLQRLRCVCNSWDSLIQEDRHLASLHLGYSRRRSGTTKTPALVSLSRSFRPSDHSDPLRHPMRYPLDNTINYSLGDDPTVHKLNLVEPLLGSVSFSITNSCHGLVGICGIDSFFILNPAIRKVARLPQSSPHIWILQKTPAAGLGLDDSTGEYKVVRLFHRGLSTPVSIGCEAISLGRGNGTRWRLMDDPPREVLFDRLPVSVNGAIYWQLQGSWETGLIGLYFDLSRERFGIIAHPNRSSRDLLRKSRSYITELGGCFCVAVTKSDSMSLWVMKDRGKSKWVKQYEIDLGKIDEQIKHFNHLEPVTFHDGKIVFHDGKGRRVYYDPRTGQSSKEDQIAKIHFQYFSPYTESIVWPW